MPAYFYDADGDDRDIEISEASLAEVQEHQLLWIDILRSDAETLRAVAKLLQLSPVSLDQIASGGQPKQLDSFEDHFQFSLPVAPGSTGLSERVDYLVAKRWLLTIRDGDLAYFEDFRAKDRGESLCGRLTPAAMAASLLDWHLEAYRADISTVEKLIDRIDAAVLEERERRPPLAALAKLRTRVGVLRSRLGEHRPIIHGILRSDFTHVSGLPHAEHFTALERRFERTEDMIDRAREIITGSFDLYATRTAQDTNKLVKMLTLVTVVIGLAGAIAGIFGMNFETSIPKSGLAGFYLAVGSMVVLSVITFALAVWRKWL